MCLPIYAILFNGCAALRTLKISGGENLEQGQSSLQSRPLYLDVMRAQQSVESIIIYEIENFYRHGGHNY